VSIQGSDAEGVFQIHEFKRLNVLAFLFI